MMAVRFAFPSNSVHVASMCNLPYTHRLVIVYTSILYGLFTVIAVYLNLTVMNVLHTQLYVYIVKVPC